MEKSKIDLFFLLYSLFKSIFPGEGPLRVIFFRRPFEIYFFPGRPFEIYLFRGNFFLAYCMPRGV